MAPQDEKKKAGPQQALAKEPGPSKALATGRAMPLGMEDVDMKSIKVPQMVLTQALSPSVVSGKFKAGMVVNNITDEVLSPDPSKPVIFIPAFYFKRRVKWVPMNQGGGIDCRSRDAIMGDKYGECRSCPHTQWRKKGERGPDDSGSPDCTLYHCLMGHVEGQHVPIILDLAKTKEKVAQKLLSVMMWSGAKTPWSKRYKFTTVLEQNKSNAKLQYHNYEFVVVPGEPSPEDQAFSEQLFKMYKDVSRNLEMELQRDEFEKEVAAAPGDGKDGAIS